MKCCHEMKCILVVGGSTFVSSSLGKQLIGQGYNVNIVFRPTYIYGENNNL